jgi:hypothetical protein
VRLPPSDPASSRPSFLLSCRAMALWEVGVSSTKKCTRRYSIGGSDCSWIRKEVMAALHGVISITAKLDSSMLEERYLDAGTLICGMLVTSEFG